ncbi:hypothetical protein [Pseudonocardia kunmingensis]|uniref:Uncharacterized protein n=1 Tax=Pseudonocardia kunmingensis TaxID=630975 RepID=A0A543D3B0_9PSEU|nr:hypothetical protein [Pseudonocardia kunmingensis]TQM03824.1 hypothetical protein FB558_6849 [Pseudonocardia kunmingensis]
MPNSSSVNTAAGSPRRTARSWAAASQVLAGAGADLEAESRLALIGDRIRAHLHAPAAPPAPDGLAAELRDLLDQAHLHRHFTRLVGTTPGRFGGSSPGVWSRFGAVSPPAARRDRTACPA